MPVFTCRHCQARCVTDNNNLDFIHECSNEFSPTLQNEDVPVIGNWSDYTGSGTEPIQTTSERGTENKLFGTRADLEGAPPLPTFTTRGNKMSITRTRQHLEFNTKTDIMKGQ